MRAASNKAGVSRPVSIRLSAAEYDDLQRRAGSLALSAYMRIVLFSDEAHGIRHAPRRVVGRVVENTLLLGKILAALGKGELQTNIALIAGEAVAGNLYTDLELIAQLEKACADIDLIRRALMLALGKNPDVGLDGLDGRVDLPGRYRGGHGWVNDRPRDDQDPEGS